MEKPLHPQDHIGQIMSELHRAGSVNGSGCAEFERSLIRERVHAGLGPALIVWVDRIEAGAFEDTNRMFVRPDIFDIQVTADGAPEYWGEQVAARVRPIFDPQKPTALFVGRYQPFHEGHRALIAEGLRRVEQVCIAVRNTPTDGNNPFGFEYVRARIEHALRQYEGRFLVVPLPNVTHIFYRRDVGYQVHRIELDEAVEAVSATEMRSRLKPQVKKDDRRAP